MTAPSRVRLSEALLARVEELADTVGGRIDDGVPEYRLIVDPGLASGRVERIRSAFRSIARELDGHTATREEVIDEAVAEARAAAQAGIDLHLLLRTHRVAQSAMWDVMIDETTRLVPSAEEQLALQKWLSALLHRWSDEVVTAVVDAYQAELHRFFYESRERVLRAELREFVAGRTQTIPSSPYPIAGTHIAAVFWGTDPAAMLSATAEALDATDTLSVEGTSGARLAWFEVSQSDHHALVARLPVRTGSHLAVGPTGHGADGFRMSHRRAWRAYRIGRWTGDAVTTYSDVALESLFIGDLRAVRDFVDQQLGLLDPTDARTETLCTTLQAYYASGCNAVGAASALQVHERTVSYRLKSIEERLGRSIVDAGEDLMVALRLRRLLQSALS